MHVLCLARPMHCVEKTSEPRCVLERGGAGVEVRWEDMVLCLGGGGGETAALFGRLLCTVYLVAAAPCGCPYATQHPLQCTRFATARPSRPPHLQWLRVGPAGCPLCMEDMDVTDKNFRPCKCGYQICLFCYRHIKDDLNGLCPACRTPYDEANVTFVTPDPQE